MEILVLGATSDIALELIFELSKKYPHAKFTLAAKDISKLAKHAGLLANRERYSFITFDARNFSSHANFCLELEKTDFSLVILAFGYLGVQAKASENFIEAQKIVEINYLGSISILENLCPQLFRKKGVRQLLALSSVAGLRGRAQNYIYGSAKAGLNCYLQGLEARFYDKGLRVKLVLLGPVRTKMTAGIEIPSFLLADKEAVARQIVKSLKTAKFMIYVPRYWYFLFKIFLFMPRNIFYRLKN